MSTTRINPTVNGYAHIGHAYLALVNQYHARATGGRFVLRFDDNQVAWKDVQGVDELCAAWIDDLDWLGIRPDLVCSQREMEHVTKRDIARVFPGLSDPGRYPPLTVPTASWTDAPQYPYAPYLTAEVVLCDGYNGVDLLIVGEELMSRYSLYMWMCERLHIDLFPHVYIPRLRDAGKEMASVSKTIGNWKIRDLRERGMSAEEVIQLLRRSCLIDATGEWDVKNVKPNPVISSAAVEA